MEFWGDEAALKRAAHSGKKIFDTCARGALADFLMMWMTKVERQLKNDPIKLSDKPSAKAAKASNGKNPIFTKKGSPATKAKPLREILKGVPKGAPSCEDLWREIQQLGKKGGRDTTKIVSENQAHEIHAGNEALLAAVEKMPEAYSALESEEKIDVTIESFTQEFNIFKKVKGDDRVKKLAEDFLQALQMQPSETAPTAVDLPGVGTTETD